MNESRRRAIWIGFFASALLSVTLAAFIEYRAEVLIWMIAGTLPLIMMFIWMGLAANGPVGGYTAADFAAYFLLVFVVRQFTVCWVVQPLSRETSVSLDAGNVWLGSFDYWYARAGISRKFDRWVVDLSHYWSDPAYKRYGFDDHRTRFVLSVSRAAKQGVAG